MLEEARSNERRLEDWVERHASVPKRVESMIEETVGRLDLQNAKNLSLLDECKSLRAELEVAEQLKLAAVVKEEEAKEQAKELRAALKRTREDS